MQKLITPPPDSLLLDVRAVAVLLDCSTRTVFRQADTGAMPSPVRVGHLVRWRRNEIERWIAAGCPNANGRS